MGLVHSIMGAVLCGALCWFGIFTTWDQFERKVIDVQSIDVPKAYVLVVIPLGFLLLFLQFARKFIAKLRETETTVNQAPMEADNAGPDSSIDMETSSTR
jgi:TRAP-type C4-dicarboxylate transport system permease small subunit